MAALAPEAMMALSSAPALLDKAGEVNKVFNKVARVGRGIFNTAKSVIGGIFGKRHHKSSRPRPQINPGGRVLVSSNPLERPTQQSPA